MVLTVGFTVNDSVDVAATGDLRTTTYVTCKNKSCNTSKQDDGRWRYQGFFYWYATKAAYTGNKNAIKQQNYDFYLADYKDAYQACYDYVKDAEGYEDCTDDTI